MIGETPSPFETIAQANAAGVYCGTLANGDTFGDEDDTSLDLEGRKIPIVSDETRDRLTALFDGLDHAQAEIDVLMRPLKKAESAIAEVRAMLLEQHGIIDTAGRCEHCNILLFAGDSGQRTTEGALLCAVCSPTVGDTLSQCEGMEESALQAALDDDRPKSEILAEVAALDPSSKVLYAL